MINNNSNIEQIKTHLKDFCDSYLTKSKNNFYICPFCDSGNGEHHTGAFSVKGKIFKCFSCNATGDIFNLYCKIHNTDFKTALNDLEEMYNLTSSPQTPQIKSSENQYKTPLKTSLDSPENQEEVLIKITDVIDSAKNNEENAKQLIKKYIQQKHKDYYKSTYLINRKITQKSLIDYFSIGYDSQKESIVLPYDNFRTYFTTRNTKEKKFFKLPTNDTIKEPLFNEDSIFKSDYVFINESIIDSLSIFESLLSSKNNIFENGYIKTQNNKKITAIALNGTANKNKFINLILNRRKEETDKKDTKKLKDINFIISFDNDEPGQKATEELLKATEDKINIITAKWNKEFKDCNDLLLFDKNFHTEIKENILSSLNNRLKEINDLKATTLFQKLQEKKKNREYNFIETPYKNFNKALGDGLYPGLYILGAITSLGKTTFLINLADYFAEVGQPVFYFSLEMGSDEIIAKSISKLTFIEAKNDIDLAKTTRGYMKYNPNENLSDYNIVKEAEEKYLNKIANNLYIKEGIGDVKTDDIRKIITNFIERTNKKPIVFIDYLQLLAPFDIRASEKQSTDRNVLELKRLSRDLNIIIFCISSFNRENYTKEVTLQSFKESGAIEYGSDVLIGLQPKAMDNSETKQGKKENEDRMKNCKKQDARDVELIILKNRNGKTNEIINFKYLAMYNYFAEANDINAEVCKQWVKK